jgi:phospholipase C
MTSLRVVSLLGALWLLAACGGEDGAPAAEGEGGAPGVAGKGGSSGGGGTSGQGGAGNGGTGAGKAGDGGAGGSASGTGGAGPAGAGGSEAGAGGGSGSSGQAGAAGAGPVDPAKLYEQLAQARQSCKFGPGQRTTETIGKEVPHGDALPFEHVVVLMMENRSFDHYFSKLPEYGVTDVDVADESHFNYDPSTQPPSKVNFYHEPRYCIKDVNHEWSGVHLQYSGGTMEGFVATNNPGGGRAMGYYDQTDLPYYYWLSKTFSISDRNFCSLLGPTWPNRFYFYGATSWGNTKTGDLGDLLPGSMPSKGKKITEQLEEANRSWKIYRDGLVSFAVVFEQSPKYFGSSMTKFEEDVDNNKLPNLAILDPSFTGSGQNDEHPPANIQKGEQLAYRVINKLMSNPEVWKKTVFFLMYDEHGGFYDHVPPPEACEPDNEVPSDFKFNRLGIRTPLIVVSPFVKKGYVSHYVTDHTSVTRFIQNRFDLPALTRRDANAWPLLDFFDFKNPPFLTPPTGAPEATLDPAAEEWCKNNPPGTGLP